MPGTSKQICLEAVRQFGLVEYGAQNGGNLRTSQLLIMRGENTHASKRRASMAISGVEASNKVLRVTSPPGLRSQSYIQDVLGGLYIPSADYSDSDCPHLIEHR